MNEQPDKEYGASLEVFRSASKAFRLIKMAYRSKTIGDSEFVAGLAKFQQASRDMDDAEVKYINPNLGELRIESVKAARFAAGMSKLEICSMVEKLQN